MSPQRIVVTAATGRLGRLVIADLLAAGVPAGSVTAVARSADRGADLAALGVALLLADYDRPETFTGAFRAGDRVLLIPSPETSGRVPQNTAVVEAAADAGVAQLAYAGAFGGPRAGYRLADDHSATEQLILDSGLPFTFLRNNWYTDAPMFTEDLAGILERGAMVNSVRPGSRLATAARADYAAAAAAVLRGGDEHLKTAYELGGDTAWTFEEFADEVSRQSGRKVVHTAVSPQERLAMLVGAGIPADLADIFVDVDRAVSAGALSAVPGDLSRLIGRPTTPMPRTVATALAALAS